MAIADDFIGTRSVLFTDLVDSTGLRVRLGEEEADVLRRTHDALLTQAVEVHLGTVIKGLGDGIMVTFKSAADAVAAAVAIQQTVESHGRQQPELAFAVRVGISSGDVTAEDNDVFGVPVVEAARLCASATQGEILVAEVVRHLARGRGGFNFVQMGDLDLKGLPEPVPTCRVIWEPLLVGPADADRQVPINPALLGATTSYVGRSSLRSQLTDEWLAAKVGRCNMVLLAGEPGVGKTRTAAELAKVAFEDGALVLLGHCDEDLDVPYQPFVEAFQYYVRHAASPDLGANPGDLVRLMPDLGIHVAGLPPSVVSDPASEEYRLFESTASWLVHAANSNDTGILLVLDDIHWATKPTLQLVHHVVRAASEQRAPILIVATYRDTDIDRSHPLSLMLSDLRRLSNVIRINVANLTNDEVVEFITASAGHELDETSRRLAHAVYSETEGNPFFVGEVIRHLVETGGVRRDGDRWIVSDPERVIVPEGVRDVVGRRLNRLSPTANDILSVAAIIGRDFDAQVLFWLTDASDDEALDALDEAVRARLVEEIGVDQFRFSHALVRTTLYDELTATRRRRLHHRVADAIERFNPDDVRALAYHCTQGGPDNGDFERAVRYTLAAADESLAARAFGDAEFGYRSALELMEIDNGELSREMVAAKCGLGEAQRDQGDVAFRRTLLDAAEVALKIGDSSLLVRAVLGNTRGLPSVMGDVDWERLGYIEQSLSLVGEKPSPDRARLLGLLASELTHSGDHLRRLSLAQEAEAMARSLGSQALLCRVLITTGYACISGHGWEELAIRCQEAVQLAEKSGDPMLQLMALRQLGGALNIVGRIDESEDVNARMIALARRDGTPVMRWVANTQSVFEAILGGNLVEAERLNNENLTFGTELDQADSEQFWSAAYLLISFLRGEAGLLADSAVQFSEQLPLSGVWQCLKIWLLAEADRPEEARQGLADHAPDPVELMIDVHPLMPPALLAMAAWYLDDKTLATRVIEAVSGHPTGWAHIYTGPLIPISWTLGLALAVAGNYEDAVSRLEEAHALVVGRGYVAYIPPIQLTLAEVLTRRNAKGDNERAELLLGEARQGAAASGASGISRRIEAILATAPSENRLRRGSGE